VLVQRAVVAQGDHRIARQGGEELHLEQLVAQGRAGLPGGLELGHQLVDALAGDGEFLDEDRRALVVLGEHRVVPLTGFAPQAELSPQAKVLQGRVEDLGLGRIERRQQVTQARDLVVQLAVVACGVKSHAG